MYSQCSKLPLDRFLDCLFDKEFERLVIDGVPPQEAIDEAWQKIYLEYLQLSQSKSYNETFEKMKRIERLNTKLILVETICQHLTFEYDTDLVGILEKEDLKPGITGGETKEVLIRKLTLVLNRAKKWLVQIEKTKAELRAEEDKSEAVVQGREIFEQTLTALSKFMGFFIKESDYMVGRYCRDVNTMLETIQKQKAQTK